VRKRPVGSIPCSLHTYVFIAEGRRVEYIPPIYLRWGLMALNIKSDEAHRLARELAEATGSSLTDAVTTALRRTLSAETRVIGPDLLLREVEELQLFVSDLPDRDPRTNEEILGYGVTGLPG